MISPIAKFALAMAEALEDLTDAVQGYDLPTHLHDDLADIEQRIKDATAEFKATGGAE